MPYEMVRLLNSDHPYRYDGTLFGGTKLWTPRELTTALWLDADSPSSITLNGATVSQWSDLSGNGRHATQATAANQPTYTANGLNGKPVLTFDGNDNLANAASLASGNASCSVAAVYSSTQSGVQVAFMTGQESSGQGLGFGYNPSGAPAYNGFVWGAEDSFNSPVLTANTPIIYLTRREAGVSLQGYLNGVAGTSPSLTTVNLQPTFVVGASAANSFRLTGTIGEIVFLSSAISTTDRQKLEGYLAWKWGTQASLPVSHPYYSAPPLV